MTTIFFDLETVPESATVGMDLSNPPGWVPEAPPDFSDRRPPSNLRDPGKIRDWWMKERHRQFAALAAHNEAQPAKAREWYAKQSLDPMSARVLVLGYAIDDDDPKALVGEEEDVLEEFEDVVRFVGPRQFVAHNGRRFDFPLLQLRALKHGQLDLARSLHQAKPWDERLIDTCEWWPRTGWGASGSSARMDDICAFLGIDRPDNPIDGSQVLDAYVSGRLDEVVQHCLADVRVLREVFVTLATMRGVILGWDRSALRAAT